MFSGLPTSHALSRQGICRSTLALNHELPPHPPPVPRHRRAGRRLTFRRRTRAVAVKFARLSTGNRACRIARFRYVFPMTAAVAHIIDEVEHLSTTERVELRRHLVERTPMSEDLTDDDFAVLAAASFRALDEEEARRA